LTVALIYFKALKNNRVCAAQLLHNSKEILDCQGLF